MIAVHIVIRLSFVPKLKTTAGISINGPFAKNFQFVLTSLMAKVYSYLCVVPRV